MAITSKEINLVQLDKELGSQGLIANFENPKEKVIMAVEGSNVTEKQLEAAINAHIAQPDEQSVESKLASVGLSVDDLKSVLGL